MLLQSLCIPGEMPASLYFRGVADLRDGAVFIKKDQEISFDTYFNMFSLKTWKEYTAVKHLSVTVRASGAGEIQLIGMDEKANETQVLAKVMIESERSSEYALLSDESLESLPPYLFVRVFAGKDGMKLEALDYTAECDTQREVRIACCFCTFKREKELMKNISNLRNGILDNPASSLYGKVEIIVADNGQSLNKDQFDAMPGVHLFYNKNYGGSAGFTRCMIEAIFRQKDDPYTHLILMDDDAVIESYVVEKTGAILSALKPEYYNSLIGGSMMSLEKPDILINNGEHLDYVRTWNAYSQSPYKSMSEVKNLVISEASFDRNFNGWWFCVVPVEAVYKNNLPLPLFLHMDDIEYGLRNKNGIISTIGICVWHPDLSMKRRPSIEYYDTRNTLITMCKLNPKTTVLGAYKTIIIGAIRPLMTYRYEKVEYLLCGVRDFFKGPHWLMSQDAEQLNWELMKKYPVEQCKLTPAELKEILVPARTDNKRILQVKKVLNMCVPAFREKIAYSDRTPWANVIAFGTRKLYIVDPDTGEGFCLTRDYRHFLKLLGQLNSLFFFMLNHYRAASAEWTAGFHEMESLTFWEKYLGLDRPNESSENED